MPEPDAPSPAAEPAPTAPGVTPAPSTRLPGPIERQAWTAGMAPAYIGAFLWVAFLDAIGARALPVGGLLPSVLGVAAGAALAVLVLYRAPARWGFLARRPLDEVAAATFGTWGVRLIPNAAIAAAQVALYALGIGLATAWVLASLQSYGLIDAASLRPVPYRGATVPSPVFATTALAWALVTALVGMGIVRWIAAIMRFFPVFPAVALALAAVLHLSGVADFRPTGRDPSTGAVLGTIEGYRLAFLTTFQWTFGFASLPALLGADWGDGSRDARDVAVGGWVGLGFAPTILATLALMATLGAAGKAQVRALDLADRPPALARSVPGPEADDGPDVPGRINPKFRPRPTAPAAEEAGPPPATLRAAIEAAPDRRIGGSILLVLGLASLGPACFAAFGFSRRLPWLVPGLTPLTATVVGATASWLLILLGVHERAEAVFTLLGALLAPAAGAIAADASRQPGGAWPGPRRGVNPAGLLAWLLGAAAGLAPLLADRLGQPALGRVAPAALLAFGVAWVAYRVLAALRLESRAIPMSDSPPQSREANLG